MAELAGWADMVAGPEPVASGDKAGLAGDVIVVQGSKTFLIQELKDTWRKP
jgi:hypothetical protein